jgi:glutamyl-tRNA(Gln) amidotransferase subunit D
MGEETQSKIRITVNSWSGEVEHEGYLLQPVKEGYITLKLINGYNISFPEESVKNKLILETSKISDTIHETPKQNNDLPKITIIHTGGTIASKVDYTTGAVVARLEPHELLEANPELAKQACISVIKLGNMWSDDMRPQHWNSILSASEDAFKSGSVGVVICHGTDSMHFSSSAVAFGWAGMGGIPPGRIVFTGSQRSSDRGSSDSSENLLAAVHWAAYGPKVNGDIGDSTVVVMHDTTADGACAVFSGVGVRKMHTSKRDAFKQINNQKLATIIIERENIEIEYEIPWTTSNRKVNNNVSLYDCELKFTHLMSNAHLQPELINFIKEKGHAGIIIHGMGLGHLPIENPLGDAPENLEVSKAIKEYVEAGGTALMVAQCINGPINMDVYSKGRIQQSLGIIGHPSTTPPDTAAVKLHWVLSNNPEEVNSLILDNLCGENQPTL